MPNVEIRNRIPLCLSGHCINDLVIYHTVYINLYLLVPQWEVLQLNRTTYSKSHGSSVIYGSVKIILPLHNTRNN